MVEFVPFDRLARTFLFVFFIFFTSGVNAEDTQKDAQKNAKQDTSCDSSTACAPVGQWEFSVGIGLGGRTNPVIDGDTTPIIVLPSLSYYGERFFFDTTTLGFTLVDQPKHLLNVIATISLDQSFFNDGGIGGFFIDPVGGGGENIDINAWAESPSRAPEPTVPPDFPVGATPPPSATPAPEPTPPPVATPTPPPVGNGGGDVADPAEINLADLHKRRMAGFLGVEYSYIWSSSSLNLQALSDVSGLYSGGQVRVSYEHLWAIGQHGLKTTAGAEWRSAQMNDYYFGIRLSEAVTAGQFYQPDADISSFIKISWQRQLTKRWGLQATFHHRWLGSEIANSPIVEDDTVSTAFIGGIYHF
ncbi:MAG: hypothetical protein COA42_21045 [Alteromonadaceae bacterium]|nr:MAG: hypothetical protein COA42_21045 [Alteromonadaceae bacterium]